MKEQITEIEDVYRTSHDTYLVGRLERDIKIGDKVKIGASSAWANEIITATISGVSMYSKNLDHANAGDVCGIKFDGIKHLVEIRKGDKIYTDLTMNYLESKRAYISGPIENGDTTTNWRIEPTRILTEKFGVRVYDPFADAKQQWVPDLNKARANKDYGTMRKIAKSFVRKDLKMVYKSDFVVAYLPYKVCTTGTIHEIIGSNENKNPTLLVCPQGKEFVPLWFYGFIPHEFMFGSWEDLWAYLDEVNEGKHINNDRWSFVYGLV